MKILLAMVMTLTVTNVVFGACSESDTKDCSQAECEKLSTDTKKFTYNASNTGLKCLGTATNVGVVATNCTEGNNSSIVGKSVTPDGKPSAGGTGVVGK